MDTHGPGLIQCTRHPVTLTHDPSLPATFVPPMQSIPIALGDRSYEVHIGAGLLADMARTVDRWCAASVAAKGSRTGVIITDRHVAPIAHQVEGVLQAGGWEISVISLEPGENTKSLDVAARCYDHLVDRRTDRRSVVFAVGGGVVGDLAGFVAATYNRGLPFVQVPTTILAAVDSSVGGKVGVNHPRAKNLIGAFHQPLGVLIDVDSFASLPEREYLSGFAEIVKYGVILDESFFDFIDTEVTPLRERDPLALRHALARSCRLKADVVERDEYERTGLRAVLNYGHTFAHAFEALCGYGELLHGEAVSIGMLYASRLAENLGRIPAAATARQEQILTALRLPTRLPGSTRPSISDMLARMRLDKKAEAGGLRFVLPTRIGHVELVSGVPEAAVDAVLREFDHR